MNITVLMDQNVINTDDPEFRTESESTTTEFHVTNGLRNLGHNVGIVGVGKSVDSIIEGLREQKPDLVFNLTEQFRDERTLDKSVAGLLDLLNIPYTGTGPEGLMLCRAKGLCKQLLSRHLIRVPGFITFHPGRSMHVPKALKFPMLVKPAYEDGSVGIHLTSLVRDEAALKDRVKLVHERWKQPAICEEFIDGREFFVSVIGNKRLTVLPPREVFFGAPGNDGPAFATYHVKWSEEYQDKWKIKFGFAEVDDDLFKRMTRMCKRAHRILQLRDYSRVDMRLGPDGKLVLLEVNPNPDIAYGEEVAEAAAKAGIPYDRLLDKIIRLAWNRYGKK